MSRKLSRPCSYPGCSALATDGSRCEKHRKQEDREYNKQRGSAASRGYDWRWQEARKLFLRKNPLCVKCSTEGRITPANTVDHIIPHRGDYELFWDRNNWQGLCKACHSRKTAKEDGRWGFDH